MTRGAYNDALIESIRVGTTDSVELASGALSLLVATLMTWWTLAIESLAALAFLVRSGPLDRWRNAILVVFVSTTYPFAPVLGFGWLLCIMGFAQCRNDEPAWRSVYIALLVGMQLFQIPWFDMLAS
jgi:hypothetical protein